MLENNDKISAADYLSNQEKEINDILGYGKKMKLYDGKNEDGTDKLIEYHFCPVPLSDIPELVKSLNMFGKVANEKDWSPESLQAVAKIIQLSLKKAHGEIAVETILKQFDFGSLAKSIRMAINLNDFLSEMQAIKQIFNQMEISTKTV